MLAIVFGPVPNYEFRKICRNLIAMSSESTLLVDIINVEE